MTGQTYVAPAVLAAVKKEFEYVLREKARFNDQHAQDRVRLTNLEGALQKTLKEADELEAFLLKGGVSYDEIARVKKAIPNLT